jgi:ProP effector
MAGAASQGAAATPELTPAECAARLAELFPALFASIPNTPPKPIKLRIQADIQARAPGLFSRRSLSPFLHRHTTTTGYLKALVASAHRYDLDGAPAGEVTDEHRQAAQAELDRRWAIVQARRAAERAARGPSPRGREGGPAGEQAGSDTPRPGGEPAQGAKETTTPGPRGPRGPRPPRGAHPTRPTHSTHSMHGPDAPHASHAPHTPRPQRPLRPQRPEPARHPGPGRPPRPAADAYPALPDDPARRERALLLRAFESSTLSRANFCALKRIDPATLDALLEQARSEARAAPARAAPQR